MFQTIQLSSCVSVQGEIVEVLNDGDVIIRDCRGTYRGRPVGDPKPACMNENSKISKPSGFLADA